MQARHEMKTVSHHVKYQILARCLISAVAQLAIFCTNAFNLLECCFKAEKNIWWQYDSEPGEQDIWTVTLDSAVYSLLAGIRVSMPLYGRSPPCCHSRGFAVLEGDCLSEQHGKSEKSKLHLRDF